MCVSRVCCCAFACVPARCRIDVCMYTCIGSYAGISAYQRLRVHMCVCVCVCVCDDNPVIRASVLALQRFTALFYSDLYNQCHISNTTNQTLRVPPATSRTHTHTHTHTHTRAHVLLHAPSWPPHCVKQMLINMKTNTYYTTYKDPFCIRKQRDEIN